MSSKNMKGFNNRPS